MADYPDFYRPISFSKQEVPALDKKEWAGKEVWYTVLVFTKENLAAGATAQSTLFTVPVNKKYNFCAVLSSIEAAGEWRMKLYQPDDTFVSDIVQIYCEPYESRFFHFPIPIPWSEGYKFRFWVKNHDTITSNFYFRCFYWEEPASLPKKPKSDDPEEHFKLGEYNICHVDLLPNEEEKIRFWKHGKDKVYFIHFKKGKLIKKGINKL